jgi:hypothetical protein
LQKLIGKRVKEVRQNKVRALLNSRCMLHAESPACPLVLHSHA